MSLKKFLQQKGFIEKEEEPAKNEGEKKAGSSGKQEQHQHQQTIEPTYFPLISGETTETKSGTTAAQPTVAAASAPVYNTVESVDPAFIKFFEDELAKSNFPGPDYFEFRKQMQAMYQKIGKGTPPHVILQAVLTSFEAMNIPAAKLLETAKQYKDILAKKKIDFLNGAAAEKDKQLKKRQDALQAHQDNLKKMQDQLLQLQNQEKQLMDMINREQTQLEVNKTLGKESIEKIERAEKQISLAHNHMVTAIDADISQLNSSHH
jgi:DNA repair exonuclease SbcCD ATPase subunit